MKSWTILAVSCVCLCSASNEQHYFIEQIFDLYGDSNKMTFEGFEHLMENLGLGGLKFEKSHNLSMHKISDGSFIDVHEELHLHIHNHSRPRRSVTVKSLQERCLSPETLLSLYGLDTGHRVSISQQGFMEICPAIVYQLDRRACSAPTVILRAPREDSAPTHAWIGASLSVLVISASGLIGVAVVPFLERSVFRRLLSSLVALAVGTLCGDALLHLLPHAYGLEDSHAATMRSSATFLALMGFFVVEAIIHMKQKQKKKKKCKKEKDPNCDYTEVQLADNPHGDHNHQHSDSLDKDGGVGSVAWMVVSGDGLHNIVDGMAVGAAFRADLVSGLATAIAVLTHELPHELGDFAVLLKAGMTVRQAVMFNVFSSVLSFIGMAAGILLGNLESATSLIYCVTAGCFLYIALADLVPELHKYRQKTDDVIPNFLLQLAGMFVGGAIMFVIALYEHSLHELLSEW